jgi:hypothetical protein
MRPRGHSFSGNRESDTSHSVRDRGRCPVWKERIWNRRWNPGCESDRAKADHG